MRFAELQNETAKPPATVVVKPDAFVATWSDRPTTDVAIGLRLIAHDDVSTARAHAAKTANAAHPDVDIEDAANWPLWVEAFNDALMLWIVARALCDPNDASQAWRPFQAAPTDMASDYLTPGGLRFLFDRWEKMRIETDPVAREADGDEIAELAGLLIDRLPLAGKMRSARCRRLLSFVVDELRAIDIPR